MIFLLARLSAISFCCGLRQRLFPRLPVRFAFLDLPVCRVFLSVCLSVSLLFCLHVRLSVESAAGRFTRSCLLGR